MWLSVLWKRGPSVDLARPRLALFTVQSADTEGKFRRGVGFSRDVKEEKMTNTASDSQLQYAAADSRDVSRRHGDGGDSGGGGGLDRGL